MQTAFLWTTEPPQPGGPAACEGLSGLSITNFFSPFLKGPGPPKDPVAIGRGSEWILEAACARCSLYARQQTCRVATETCKAARPVPGLRTGQGVELRDLPTPWGTTGALRPIPSP